jgi:hypothetical protein
MPPITILMKKMTKTATGDAILIENLFTDKEIDYILKYLSNMVQPTDGHKALYKGIHPNHWMYGWFNKHVFDKICQALGRKDLKFTMAQYVNDEKPQVLHSDYYHTHKPGMAMVVPISVEHDRSCSKLVHTIIFNEQDTVVGDMELWDRSEWDRVRCPKDNNALQYKDQYLSHIADTDLECLTVKEIMPWRPGSVVCWNEEYLHASDNFKKNNILSKQFIVIHSHVL